MTIPIPQTIDQAVTEAIAATRRALDDGYRRIQVELAVPDIALQAQAIASEVGQCLFCTWQVSQDVKPRRKYSFNRNLWHKYKYSLYFRDAPSRFIR